MTAGAKSAIAGCIIAVFLLVAPCAIAQTVKIGIVNSLTGPLAPFGRRLQNGIDLYMKTHKSPRLSITTIDDESNPAKAAAAAQRLIDQDKVDLITGIISSPEAFAVASVTSAAKVPLLIMNAADPSITRKFPYTASVSATVPQEARPLGRWAAWKGFRTAYAAIADFPLAQAAGESFAGAFEQRGGKLYGATTAPSSAPDFVPLLMKLRQEKPDIVFASLFPGPPTSGFLKQFREIAPTGTSIAAMPEMLLDDMLPALGERALGVFSSGTYSAAAERPENAAYVSAYKQAYGDGAIPEVMSVEASDALTAIADLASHSRGNAFSADQAMSFFKTWSRPDSPRGPIHLDAESRALVATVYIRRTELRDGRPANIEIQRFTEVNADGSGGGGDPCTYFNQCKCHDETCSIDCCRKH